MKCCKESHCKYVEAGKSYLTVLKDRFCPILEPKRCECSCGRNAGIILSGVVVAGTLSYIGYKMFRRNRVTNPQIPEGATPVEGFELEKYLGKWYEIARLDFKWERNMDQTTAEYSLNPDGTVKVVNRGYNYKKEKWQKAEGTLIPQGEYSGYAEGSNYCFWGRAFLLELYYLLSIVLF